MESKSKIRTLGGRKSGYKKIKLISIDASRQTFFIFLTLIEKVIYGAVTKFDVVGFS